MTMAASAPRSPCNLTESLHTTAEVEAFNTVRYYCAARAGRVFSTAPPCHASTSRHVAVGQVLTCHVVAVLLVAVLQTLALSVLEC